MLTPSKATFEFDSRTISPRDITTIVEKLGYGSSLITEENRMAAFDEKAEIRKWRVNFFVSLFVYLLVIAVIVYFHWMRDTNNQMRIIDGLSLDNLLLFALCTLAQVSLFRNNFFSAYLIFAIP